MGCEGVPDCRDTRKREVVKTPASVRAWTSLRVEDTKCNEKGIVSEKGKCWLVL